MTKKNLIAAIFAAAVCVVSGQLSAQDVTSPKMKAAPTIDGKLDDWKGVATSIGMSDTSNIDDLKVENAYVTWDDKNLYVAVKVMDKKIVNDQPIERMQAADAVELRLVTKNINLGSFYRIVIAPTTKDGKPTFKLTERDANSKNETTVVSTTENTDKSGVKWALVKDDTSWTVEASIPLSLIALTAPAGKKIPFVLVVWDRDRTDINEWAEWNKRTESSSQKKKIDEWPSLILAE
ncbi:MAG TPA: hypothetical protein DCZ94_15550 [Lentisphaeria bacterium]|nr:MAG: hypothetical protein A2X48_17065 [Lentisphaerae bacterium GWF2_49_21]HBC88364.1 hypothetical protein [Lentisphaeria bacterium]